MRTVLLCLCAALLLSACGKKGNPLPPLVRIPAAPADFSVTRIDDHVYVRFTVPVNNIDGATPADVDRIEVYAFTFDGLPPDLTRLDAEELREASTLVATERVRRPLPPPPPVKEGMPPIPLPPPVPGLDQGATAVIAEQLSAQSRSPVELPQPEGLEAPEALEAPVGPLVAPRSGAGLQRFYYAVAASGRDRYGPPTAFVPAPLGSTSGPPSEPRITVTENEVELRWSPPRDARGLGLATDPEWLPATPTVPGPPQTTYDVYEVPRNRADDAPLTVPTPLTPEPISATEFRQSDFTLGQERCFYVRAVDIVGGIHVRGPASPVACASFDDTFPPNPPRQLVAVAVGGGINLIWDPSDSADIAGYLVLRGEAGGATLTALQQAPLKAPSYRDETVKPGVRYVYAVAAVDAAGNRSPESNRVEETAQ